MWWMYGVYSKLYCKLTSQRSRKEAADAGRVIHCLFAWYIYSTCVVCESYRPIRLPLAVLWIVVWTGAYGTRGLFFRDDGIGSHEVRDVVRLMMEQYPHRIWSNGQQKGGLYVQWPARSVSEGGAKC